jgi:hypothetical protein
MHDPSCKYYSGNLPRYSVKLLRKDNPPRAVVPPRADNPPPTYGPRPRPVKGYRAPSMIPPGKVMPRPPHPKKRGRQEDVEDESLPTPALKKKKPAARKENSQPKPPDKDPEPENDEEDLY